MSDQNQVKKRIAVLYNNSFSYLDQRILCPGILCRVGQVLRLVIRDILYTQVLEHFKESLAVMTESYCTMVRITFLDQYMTIETSHFMDSEDTDTVATGSTSPSAM